MALPYPQDPGSPSAPNPYFADNGFVRGDQQRSWSAQAWANMTDLDSRLTTAEDDITALDGRLTTAEADIVALEAKRIFDPMHLEGLTISNAVSDPTDDITFAAGSCRDASDAVDMVFPNPITKQLNAAFAAGTNQGMLDTGAVGNNTYHLWAICKDAPAEGQPGADEDYLASLSATSPTMPSGYTYKRYLWPIYRSGGVNVKFTQVGRRFNLTTSVSYSTGANPGTSRLTAPLTGIPTGIVLQAILTFRVSGAECFGTCRPLTETNGVPAATSPPGHDAAAYDIGGGLAPGTVELEVTTNTSAQVAIRLSASGSGQLATALQKGWIVPE